MDGHRTAVEQGVTLGDLFASYGPGIGHGFRIDSQQLAALPLHQVGRCQLVLAVFRKLETPSGRT